MLKSSLLALSAALFLQVSYADTCPTVKDIKSGALGGWKVYDSDDGTLLSAKRSAAFKQTLKEFALAEWVSSKNGGSMHCYYRDQMGSNLEAYLSKDLFHPKKQNAFWYEVSGSQHCAAGMDKCQFEQNTLQPIHLAKIPNNKKQS